MWVSVVATASCTDGALSGARRRTNGSMAIAAAAAWFAALLMITLPSVVAAVACNDDGLPGSSKRRDRGATATVAKTLQASASSS